MFQCYKAMAPCLPVPSAFLSDTTINLSPFFLVSASYSFICNHYNLKKLLDNHTDILSGMPANLDPSVVHSSVYLIEMKASNSLNFLTSLIILLFSFAQPSLVYIHLQVYLCTCTLLVHQLLLFT